MSNTVEFWQHLTSLNVPIATAPPRGDDYDRPAGWQNLITDGNAARIATYEPGHAVLGVLGDQVAVVDVDTKNGGNIERTRQLLDGIDCRIYAHIRTPSGGAHFYVPGHPDLPSVSATSDRDGLEGHPGVEILSHGRNAYLPGTSRHKYGGAGYTIISDTLDTLADGGDPDSAEALVAWVAAHRVNASSHDDTPVAPPWDGTPPDRRQQAYLDAALTNSIERLQRLEIGSRNSSLNATAYSLGRLVAGAGLDPQKAAEQLLEACKSNGLLAEDGHAQCLATIRSGLRAGAGRPRAVPDTVDLLAGGGSVTTSGEIPAAPMESAAQAGTPDLADSPHEVSTRLTPGGAFILDIPEAIPAVWGDGDDVLWAEGEALTICGPAGVGKTTLTGQVVRARIAGGHVLGLPVTPTESKILYLAMDRPRQIARSLRRTLGDLDRDTLDEKLVVWSGPPIADVAAHPETLLGLVQLAGADTVIVDSIKDAAVGLSNDEVGAGYNRARQMCIAAGIQVLEQHHMVKKGENGQRPNSLADLYGSVWIGAGAGSVVLLYGVAGDPIVDFRHLKTPADEVGPYRVIHDHAAGRSDVWHQADLVMMAKACGRAGLSAKAAASSIEEKENPSKSDVEKARRRLDKLVDQGLLERVDGVRGGQGDVRQAAVWRYLQPLEPVDNSLEGNHDAITGNHVPHSETARQSRGPQKTPETRGSGNHEDNHGNHGAITLATPSVRGGGREGATATKPNIVERSIAGERVMFNLDTGEVVES